MTEFKSSAIIIIRDIAYGVFGGAALTFIANAFMDLKYAIIIGAAAAIFMLYRALFGDRVRVVLSDRELEVYRGKKLKYSYKRSEVSVSATMRTKGTDSDCTLKVTEPDGNTRSIDCSLLGASRFQRLLEALELADRRKA